MVRKKSSTPRLTERETEIMQMLWEKGPLFVREMLTHYPDPKPHFNTVSTTVRILENKGYVGHESVAGSFPYHAVAEPDYFAGRSLAGVIRSFFLGSAAAAVSALVEEEKISVDELKQIIEMVEKHKSE